MMIETSTQRVLLCNELNVMLIQVVILDFETDSSLQAVQYSLAYLL